MEIICQWTNHDAGNRFARLKNRAAINVDIKTGAAIPPWYHAELSADGRLSRLQYLYCDHGICNKQWSIKSLRRSVVVFKELS
ncbi:hypothetical protein AVEN_33953-1 [Araneus ventricosus]|uniref:Uncharacterized protein n=1 Tax=Araneus ventricosus TaxID=182803 RepID=A0A4Y2IU47_ARAVE|nr:hypothetical protein AVEN_33953-1 [Araneus ventricosus]